MLYNKHAKQKGVFLMKKFSRLFVVLASATLIMACNKNSGGGSSSNPSKDQIVEAYHKMAGLKNFTSRVDIELTSKSVQYDPISYSMKFPLKSQNKIYTISELQEGSERETSKTELSRYEADLVEVTKYFNDNGNVCTVDEVIEQFKAYKPKIGETYVIDEQAKTLVYEKNYSSREPNVSYNVYDSTVKQYYILDQEEDGSIEFDTYTFDGESDGDGIASIVGINSIEELFEKGKYDQKTGIYSYDTVSEGKTIRAEVRFKVSNGYLDSMNLVLDNGENGKLSIDVAYSKINSTSFAVPNVRPTCKYDHTLAHTPSAYHVSEAGHRLACSSCRKYLTNNYEQHVHSHNGYGICETCGFIVNKKSGTVDLNDEVLNLVNYKQTTENEKLIYYSYESADKQKSYTSDGTSYSIRFYEEQKALVYSICPKGVSVAENSCVHYYDYTHKFYKNLTDEQITTIKTDDSSFTKTKALIETLTPSNEINSYSEGYTSHVYKDLAECETKDIDGCHSETYQTCELCNLVLYVSEDTHHDYEHTSTVETVINGCVTKVDTICERCNEVINTNYEEDHKHKHEVFCTESELDNYGINHSEFTHHYEHSLFYFYYCDDCGQVGNSYTYAQLYEVDDDYQHDMNHQNYATHGYTYTLDKDKETGHYILKNPRYEYESEYLGIPHHVVDGVCSLCGSIVFDNFPDNLEQLIIHKDEEKGLEWEFLYRYSEDGVQHPAYVGRVGEIEDHVATYNVITQNTYMVKEYLNDDDIFVNKIEVISHEGELLLTVEC